MQHDKNQYDGSLTFKTSFVDCYCAIYLKKLENIFYLSHLLFEGILYKIIQCFKALKTKIGYFPLYQQQYQLWIVYDPHFVENHLLDVYNTTVAIMCHPLTVKRHTPGVPLLIKEPLTYSDIVVCCEKIPPRCT